MAIVQFHARWVQQGLVRCVCGYNVRIPQPIPLALVIADERGLMRDAINFATIHRCGVLRIWWCPSCREERLAPRFRRRRGRFMAFGSDRCSVCASTLIQREL